MQKINDAFNGFKIDDENKEEPRSDKDLEEKDPNYCCPIKLFEG